MNNWSVLFSGLLGDFALCTLQDGLPGRMVARHSVFGRFHGDNVHYRDFLVVAGDLWTNHLGVQNLSEYGLKRPRAFGLALRIA